jgi:hypothetical protein
MEKVYVPMKKRARRGRFRAFFLVVLFLCLYALISSLVQTVCGGLREELIEALGKEKQAADRNGSLKMELSVMTRGRYVELSAGERLGLKKPKEEEVLVLR